MPDLERPMPIRLESKSGRIFHLEIEEVVGEPTGPYPTLIQWGERLFLNHARSDLYKEVEPTIIPPDIDELIS